ncbi:MAG: UDP-2,3-diacylglucosamine diphosphatase [Flavobacteriales bacterium]
MKKRKRKVKAVIISDVHLGTYGCHAKELLRYLKSIKPEILILNGDIIDVWQFSKRYWPKSHMKVIKHLTSLISKGVTIYYITGNHDEVLRKFTGFSLGSFQIVNKLVLELDGKKSWIFHGDVFDVTMKHSKWLAKLGGKGYEWLILLNRLVNGILQKMGRPKISLSKRIKDNVKSAVKYINNFEQVAADLAVEKKYDFVVCGHIHQPVIRTMSNQKGSVVYMNSGDWVENLTSLEYNDGEWKIYQYYNDEIAQKIHLSENTVVEMTPNMLFKKLVKDFEIAS